MGDTGAFIIDELVRKQKADKEFKEFIFSIKKHFDQQSNAALKGDDVLRIFDSQLASISAEVEDALLKGKEGKELNLSRSQCVMNDLK